MALNCTPAAQPSVVSMTEVTVAGVVATPVIRRSTSAATSSSKASSA
jgi:hypothetical protein